jgi:uncharacterized protein (DUF58 family)
VAWLFLLGYWILALVLVAFVYSIWNLSRLRGLLGVAAVRYDPRASPRSELPESLIRSSPRTVVFEGDELRIKLGARTVGGPAGPVRIKGYIAGGELSAASGLVSRSGWEERPLVGPLGRGQVQSTSWVMEASDPLGLFAFDVHWQDREIALVLPRFTSLTSRPQVRELEASVAAPRAGSGTEMFGVREYRPGDPLRRIHWRSSARHGELIVREFEPPGVQTLGIFCDPSPPTREAADQIARIAASEAWDCLRAGGRVALWTPGVEASRPEDMRSLWALLEWLARYPHVPGRRGDMDSELPRVGDAIAVMAGANPDVDEALETIRHRGGKVRAWVVGHAELDSTQVSFSPAIATFSSDISVQRAGLAWPLQ